ncbi:MAG: type VII secretion-associated serine protease mycosin, partial [Micromonosporaceae bacterium]|nr:type VII secretion-associated serine protease mycosin [Micromonosporaceae bacterium]
VAPAVAAAKVCGPRITAPLAEAPWAQARLRPDLAWPLSTGAGITVAVIDSGVSDNHPSLAGKVLPGRDYLASGGNGHCDQNGHGTLIAGLIAGRPETSAGYRFFGVAPDARILPVRVLLDQQRSLDPALSGTIANAIRWSVDVGRAQVVNLSLTTEPTKALASAVAHAIAKGAVVVAATGNGGDTAGGDGTATYPAAYPGVIGVAGVDDQDQHVGTSTTGSFVDVAAPGLRIAGPSPAGGGYLFAADGGTSFAAGYVSGVVALIRAYHRELTPDQVLQRLTQTAQHPPGGWNPDVGFGVVDPVRAVGALMVAGAGAASAPGDQRVPAPVIKRKATSVVTVAAVLVGAGGVAVAGLVVVAVPVVRRGRRRQWRPAGRRPA